MITKENGIYRITNIVNNKIYIGSAFCKGGLNRRWVAHKSTLKRNKHFNQYLQNSWNKYGKDNFIFEVLEIVSDSDKIYLREQFYIDFYKSYEVNIGYNVSRVTSAPMLGLKHTNEAKLKIGAASKGNKYCLGFKHSDETKKLMTEARYNESKETREKRAKSLIGNKNGLGFKPDSIISVNQLDKNNNIIKTWESMTYAAKELNLHAGNICRVCKGERKTCGGFKWEIVK